jgi:hypothetical protein
MVAKALPTIPTIIGISDPLCPFSDRDIDKIDAKIYLDPSSFVLLDYSAL